MNSLIGLDAVSITAIAIITAVIIMNKCSANPIAVRTESIEKTRSRTTICRNLRAMFNKATLTNQEIRTLHGIVTALSNYTPDSK